LQLRLVQLLEAVPEMDEHEVALVAEQGKDGALAAAGGLLQRCQGRVASARIAARASAGEGAPRRPAEAHHLVQHAGAFDGQGDLGQRDFDRHLR
jgi:hypothetical protein